MKTIYYVIFTILLVFSVQNVLAQKNVRGTVSDDSGPLPGVSVIIQGTSKGVETDFDGKYSIEAKEGDVLQYSYVGMESVNKKVGTANVINVLMKVSSDNVLGEVVINALGIETRQVSRTASISKVDGEAIVNSGETSLVKGLSAKSSGVSIVNSSGDPGSSTYVQIRGQTTITRDLQPLYVIDGIPVNNDELGNTVDGTSEQARMNDINPDDVASVKILKGASAAALWGSRAANGVILITTKSGKKGDLDKFNVSISSKISFDTPLTRLQLQDKFGKGYNGIWNGGANRYSWGDLIENRSGEADVYNTNGAYFVPYNQDGNLMTDTNGDLVKIYPILEKNSKETFLDKNYDSVFGTGTYFETNVALSTYTDNGSFYASFSKLNQDGVIGGGDGTNFYDRYTGRMNAGIKITDKVNMKGNLSYSNINSNRIQQGSNLNGLLLGLYRTAVDFDNTYYVGSRYVGSNVYQNSHRAYRFQTGTIYKQSPEYNNPLWTLYKQKNPNTVNRFIGGLETKYDANDWLEFIVKGGIDFYTDARISLFPINSSYPDTGKGIGAVEQDDIMYNQYDLTFMSQINKDISELINSYFILGINVNQEIYEERYGGYQDFAIDTDQIIFSNTVASEETYHGTYSSKQRTNAFYGVANFDYNNLILLNLTGRLDQSSTFGTDVVSFYPSVELGFQFSELLENDLLSNSKLRLSYAKVGNQPQVYSTQAKYSLSSGGDSYGTFYDSGPYGSAYVPSTILYAEDLRPETLEEFEIGIDLNFWENRIRTTFNYYDNKTTDALLYLPYNPSSGYGFKYANAAILSNVGYEAELGIDLIRKDNLNWDISANWSKNNNLVESLSGAEEVPLAGFLSTTSSAVEGYPLGALFGDVYEKDDTGNYVLDEQGFPQLASEQAVFGDPNPDWTGNLSSSLRWKKFTLSGRFDISMGGQTWNGTKGALTTIGTAAETANMVTVSAEDAETIFNYDTPNNPSRPISQISGAILNEDGTYTVRGNLYDFGGGTVLLDQNWYDDIGGGLSGGSSEPFLDDGSWAKLRELSLSYDFSGKIFKNIPIQSINVGLTARNIWLWTKANLDYDPESNLTGASNGRGLQYFNHPTNKSYIANIKINF